MRIISTRRLMRSNLRDISKVILTAGIWSLVTDTSEGLQFKLFADRVERQDLVWGYFCSDSQIELRLILTVNMINKLFFFLKYLGNFLWPTGKLEAAVLSVHGIIFDINVTLAGVDTLGQPRHVTIVPNLAVSSVSCFTTYNTWKIITWIRVLTSILSPTLL